MPVTSLHLKIGNDGPKKGPSVLSETGEENLKICSDSLSSSRVPLKGLVHKSGRKHAPSSKSKVYSVKLASTAGKDSRWSGGGLGLPREVLKEL